MTAADLAGNVAVETADVTLDSAGPTRPYITVDGRLVSDPSSGVLVEMPWTFADTTVSADGSTALSGIKEYAYTTYDEGNVKGATVAYEAGSPILLSGNQIVTYEFMATSFADNAGATSKVKVKILQSISAPKITIDEAPSEAGWYQNLQYITAVNTQAFGASEISLWYTIDDANGALTEAAADGNIPVIDGEHTYYVYARALDTVLSEPTSVTVKAENSLPTLEVTTGYQDGAWTSADQTFVLNASATSGISHYLVNGAAQASPYIAATKGTYTFAAVSNAGQISNTVTYTVNIDKTIPTISVSHAPNGSNGWYNAAFAGDVIPITVAADGTGSAITALEYSADGGLSWNEAVLSAGVFSAPKTEGETGYTFRAVDQAGNIATAQTTVKVDLTAPAISGVTASAGGANYTFGSWTKASPVTTTIAAADSGSGIAMYNFYDVNDEAEWKSSASNATEAKAGASTKESLNPAVRDNAGNIALYGQLLTVKIDRTAVSLNTPDMGGYTSGNWTTTDVTAKLSTTPASNEILSGVTYYYQTGSTTPSAPTASNLGAWAEVGASALNITGNTNTHYYFVAISGSGNVSNIQSATVLICKHQQ